VQRNPEYAAAVGAPQRLRLDRRLVKASCGKRQQLVEQGPDMARDHRFARDGDDQQLILGG